jgi:hypothetical protein
MHTISPKNWGIYSGGAKVRSRPLKDWQYGIMRLKHVELIPLGLLPDQFNRIISISLTSLLIDPRMLLQNPLMQRSKLLEQHLEVLEILNSSCSDYRKYMPKTSPQLFRLIRVRPIKPGFKNTKKKRQCLNIH